MESKTQPKGFKKIGVKLAKWYRDEKLELKKVIWPTKKQLINNTLTVFFMFFVTGLIIWAADFCLTYLRNWIYKV